jgi:predicted AlkP superfamily pyrophosphatase or phosphodiesterase
MLNSAMSVLHVSRVVAAACLAAGLATAGCARPSFIVTPALPAVDWHAPATRVTENVVLVSIDGLRPDAIAAFKAVTLQRLIDEGSYTLSARTIMPSKTLPSHTSMLTGEPPDDHGVLWNNVMDDAPGTIEIPTVFSEARARGYRTAAFFSKAKFSHLQRPGTLDYSQAPGGWFGKWSAAETVADVARHMETSKPNLLFVHLPDPDSEGHAHGWMSAAYGRGVLRADAAVARLLDLANETYGKNNYTIIVTADHGGHGHDHGSDDPRDVTIPWIAWGRGVTPGELPPNTVHTMDTASTALFLLGVDRPSAWAGTAIRSAFAAAN